MACEDDDFSTFASLKQLASGIDPGDSGGGNMLSTSYESTGSFFGLPLEPLADFTYDGAGLDDDFLEDLMDQLDDESSADKFLSDSIFGDFDLMTEEAFADVDDFELVLSENDGSNFCSSDGGKDGCMMELDEEVENSKVSSGPVGKNVVPSSPSKKNSSPNKKLGLMKSSNSNNSLLSKMNVTNVVPRVVMNNRSSNKQNCLKKVSKQKRRKAGVSLLAKPSKQVKSLLDTTSSRLSTRTVPIAAVPSSNTSNNPILLKTSKGDFRISKVVVENTSSNACKMVNGMIVKRITPMSQCVSMKTQYVTTKSNNQSIQMQKYSSSTSSMPSYISSSSSSTSNTKLLFQDHDYCPANSSSSCSLIVIDN